MRKRIAVVVIAMQFVIFAAMAADAPKRCKRCVGALNHADMFPVSDTPVLVTDVTSIGPNLIEVHPSLRRNWTLLMDIRINPSGGDPLLQIEHQTSDIVAWASARGPFAAFGTKVTGPDPALTAHALKRLAAAAQGRNLASAIVIRPASIDELAKVFEAGAQAHFDVVLVDGPAVAPMAKWLAEHHAAKKIYALVTPHSPNSMFDLARALADGATIAYLSEVPIVNGLADYSSFDALTNFNKSLAGDYAFDATAHTMVLDARGKSVDMPTLTFVRREDWRTILVPAGDATATTTVSLPSDRFTRPRLVDSTGDRPITDVGTKDGHFLIGVQPVKGPFILTVDRAEASVAKETRRDPAAIP